MRGFWLPPGDLARLCQKAEVNFVGAPCGIMDQSISIMARPGHALLLDCRTVQTKQIPFNDPRAVLLVADTQVKHDTGEGGYPQRHRQCEQAASALGVQFLRDADVERVESAAGDGTLSGVLLARARHVVTEIRRTLAAADALKGGRLEEFGKLMYASHASMRDDFEISCDELDAIVEIAGDCEGVYGARMTGGGFGGCAIILMRDDRAGAITETIVEGFERRFGRKCPVFPTGAAEGARILE